MRFLVYFKHMLPSAAVQEYAEDKLAERIGKYALYFSEVQLTFAVEHHHAEVSCTFVAEGHSLHLVERGPNMNAAIDRLADRVDGRLRRMKEKMRSHRLNKSLDELEHVAMAVES